MSRFRWVEPVNGTTVEFEANDAVSFLQNCNNAVIEIRRRCKETVGKLSFYRAVYLELGFPDRGGWIRARLTPNSEAMRLPSRDGDLSGDTAPADLEITKTNFKDWWKSIQTFEQIRAARKGIALSKPVAEFDEIDALDGITELDGFEF